MSLSIDEKLITNFESLLSSPPPAGKQKEQVVQDFLEEYTELIPMTNLLNHQLHFGIVVSKFPLANELVTDYLYITKSSDVWRITLVELEAPDKLIFTTSMKKANTTATFNAAVHQVRSWQSFIDDHKTEALRKLVPLLKPLGNNPIEFHFQLVIGRSSDKNLSEDRKKLFRRNITDFGYEILTYDTLLNWYRNGTRFKKNVLRLSGVHFAFKHMHIEPTSILTHVGPDHLELTRQQTDDLYAKGYEIDKWRMGERLVYNYKYTESTWKKKCAEGTEPNS